MMQSTRPDALLLRGAAILAAATALAGCGALKVVVASRVPQPTLQAMPIPLGVRIPASFAEYVRKEEINAAKWEISIGPAQADAFRRVASAMFAGSQVLANVEVPVAGAEAPRITLETVLDNYVFLTPSENSDYFAATIWYRANLYGPEGTLLGSWPFQGYGSVTGRGRNSREGVNEATGLAVRDAFANFAANYPNQPLVKQLLPPPSAAIEQSSIATPTASQ